MNNNLDNLFSNRVQEELAEMDRLERNATALDGRTGHDDSTKKNIVRSRAEVLRKSVAKQQSDLLSSTGDAEVYE